MSVNKIYLVIHAVGLGYPDKSDALKGGLDGMQ